AGRRLREAARHLAAHRGRRGGRAALAGERAELLQIVVELLLIGGNVLRIVLLIGLQLADVLHDLLLELLQLVLGIVLLILLILRIVGRARFGILLILLVLRIVVMMMV